MPIQAARLLSSRPQRRRQRQRPGVTLSLPNYSSLEANRRALGMSASERTSWFLRSPTQYMRLDGKIRLPRLLFQVQVPSLAHGSTDGTLQITIFAQFFRLSGMLVSAN